MAVNSFIIVSVHLKEYAQSSYLHALVSLEACRFLINMIQCCFYGKQANRLVIAIAPVKQPCRYAYLDQIKPPATHSPKNVTKQSTTKPSTYLMGYTLYVINWHYKPPGGLILLIVTWYSSVTYQYNSSSESFILCLCRTCLELRHESNFSECGDIIRSCSV